MGWRCRCGLGAERGTAGAPGRGAGGLVAAGVLLLCRAELRLMTAGRVI